MFKPSMQPLKRTYQSLLSMILLGPAAALAQTNIDTDTSEVSSQLEAAATFIMELLNGPLGWLLVIIGFLIAVITALARSSFMSFLFIFGLTMFIKFFPAILAALFGFGG